MTQRTRRGRWKTTLFLTPHYSTSKTNPTTKLLQLNHGTSRYIYIYAIQISWGGASSPSQCCWQKVQTSPFAQSQSFQKKERFGRKHEVKVYYDSTKQECPLGIEFNAFGGYRHREIAESNCCKKRNLTQPSATFWGMVIDQTKSSKATSRTLTCPHRFGIPSGPCTCSLSCCVRGLLPTIR